MVLPVHTEAAWRSGSSLVATGEFIQHGPKVGRLKVNRVHRQRITHVITEARPLGGAQLNTYYSLRYQQSACDVSLLVGTEGPLVDMCREIGIEALVIPMQNRLVTPVSDVISLVHMTRYFRRVRPHIVHTHSSKAGMLGRLAACLAGVPVVVHTVHGPSFHDRQRRVVRVIIRSIERALALRTDRIITVAETLAGDLVRQRVCRPDSICAVVSGIDFDTFPSAPEVVRRRVRRSLGASDDDCLIFSVAHLMQDKGHEVLIQVANLVSAARQDVKVVVVGDGPLRDELQAQIEALGLISHVALIGAREDVPDLLTAADIFVQTSWREGLSRSLVEAMYSGLPVVATDVGATREVVKDGKSGYLVPPGDAHALAGRLLQLIGSREERARIGVTAHDVVAEDRSVQAMGESLASVYGELMERKGLSRVTSMQFSDVSSQNSRTSNYEAHI